MTCREDLEWSVPGFRCTGPIACSPSKSGCGGIGMGSGLVGRLVVTSGVGQGKESSEELLDWLGRERSVVYGVCATWSDRLVGIRVWG